MTYNVNIWYATPWKGCSDPRLRSAGPDHDFNTKLTYNLFKSTTALWGLLRETTSLANSSFLARVLGH